MTPEEHSPLEHC